MALHGQGSFSFPIGSACGVKRSLRHASMLAAAAQAGGDDEDGWEDGGDLEDDDEGDGEGEGTGTPRWLPRANGAPHDPSQPVVIGGNHYLVGGTAEMQARAQSSV